MLHSHHDHSHDHGAGSYFVEQLAMIGVCGALGGVAILLYVRGVLDVMLNRGLHWMVLATGIAMLVLVAIRAVALWFEAAKPHAHGHDHDHHHHHDHDHACGHDHHHDHGDCGHHHEHVHAHPHQHAVTAQAPAQSLPLVTAPAAQAVPAAAPAPHEHGNGPDHDHGHEHGGWGPWRYAVLLLPITLFFLDLPNEGFNAARAGDDLRDPGLEAQSSGGGPGDADKIRELGFKELQAAVYNKESRAEYEGKFYKIKGMYLPINDRVFSLQRFKINCCAADAIPLNAFILLDSETQERLDVSKLGGKWVLVTGQVQFRERNGQTIPVIVVKPTPDLSLAECVKQTDPDRNPYIN
jgi:hypothetical protein